MSKRLKRIQRKYRDSVMEQLDPGGAWSAWLPVSAEPATSRKNKFHLFDVDRFLSIYNRPVRRRQISHEPGAIFPSTGVVRNPADGAVYILGADRTDTDGSLTIETLTTLHEVGQTGTVTRRQLSATATPEDPGWLDQVQVGEFYFDSELRTVTEESEQAGEFVGKYFTFTNCSDLQPNDVLTIGQDSYIVEAPYKDAGFNSARVAKLKDCRQDVVINKQQSTAGVTSSKYDPHNPTASSTSTDPEPFNVTAWIGSSMSEPATAMTAADELRVFIDKTAIGFRPTASHSVVVDGVEWSVEDVKYSHQFEQYRLDCRRV